jgi:hypothetical protein
MTRARRSVAVGLHAAQQVAYQQRSARRSPRIALSPHAFQERHAFDTTNPSLTLANRVPRHAFHSQLPNFKSTSCVMIDWGIQTWAFRKLNRTALRAGQLRMRACNANEALDSHARSSTHLLPVWLV